MASYTKLPAFWGARINAREKNGCCILRVVAASLCNGEEEEEEEGSVNRVTEGEIILFP